MILDVRKLDSFSDDLYLSAYRQLSPVRRARIDRLYAAEDKRRSVFGEYLARKMIGNKLCIPPEAVEITYSSNGKPLTGQTYFSISHSGEYVACAIDDSPIGIDIEHKLRCDPRLERMICTDHEREICESLSPEAREVFLLRLWVLKEACIKCNDQTLLQMRQIGFSFGRQHTLLCDNSELDCKLHYPFDDCVLAACTLRTREEHALRRSFPR